MIHQISTAAGYERKQAEAIDQFQSLLSQGETISIKKNVKHIFKERDKAPNLDRRQFNQVISIDTPMLLVLLKLHVCCGIVY